MSFQFSLEAVLRLRRSQKRAEELRLAAILAELARQRQSLEGLEAQMGNLGSWAHSAEPAAYGAELHFLQYQRGQLVTLREQTLRTLAEWEQKRVAQQLLLQAAHQSVETLESLRAEQTARYRTESDRREQLRTDERTLQRRWRTRENFGAE